MGGLSKSTNLFVDLYDEWMDDEQAYLDWVDFFKRHVSMPVASALELACGTGNISKYIAKDIPRYVASDIDEDMLKQAKDKLPEHVELCVMNMQKITINETFDCVLCGADSMNFNQSVEELALVADTVWDHLHDKGVFIFDVHHPLRLSQYQEAYVETGSIHGINFEYILSSHNQKLTHEFHWYTTTYPVVQEYMQHVFFKGEIQQAFPSSKWKLSVENDEGKPGFVDGEKWLIVAHAIKSEGDSQ
jgi:SAM-dependent methyltransferase